MRKIGIFGGSFDPIHYGHLRPALEILDAFCLDSMRFIPAGHPPHRESPLAPAELRVAMVKAAVADEPRFTVDERELRRETPSYTADTLMELRREFPKDALVLLVGMDAFLGLPSWHRWQELTELAHVAVMHRPGIDLPLAGPLAGLLDERRELDPGKALTRPAGSVLLHAVTQLEISSTRIRELAAAGGDLRYLLPPAVCSLITKSACYRKET
jgi:nicotinate-nucleotide adenylyltransferase